MAITASTLVQYWYSFDFGSGELEYQGEAGWSNASSDLDEADWIQYDASSRLVWETRSGIILQELDDTICITNVESLVAGSLYRWATSERYYQQQASSWKTWGVSLYHSRAHGNFRKSSAFFLHPLLAHSIPSVKYLAKCLCVLWKIEKSRFNSQYSVCSQEDCNRSRTMRGRQDPFKNSETLWRLRYRYRRCWQWIRIGLDIIAFSSSISSQHSVMLLKVHSECFKQIKTKRLQEDDWERSAQ